MNLTDIMPAEKWIELEKDIYERSGLASNVFNIDGIRITDYKVWVNRLCPVVKADDRGQSFICAVAHMNIGMNKTVTTAKIINVAKIGETANLLINIFLIFLVALTFIVVKFSIILLL